MGGYNEKKESSLNIDYFEIIPKTQRERDKNKKRWNKRYAYYIGICYI